MNDAFGLPQSVLLLGGTSDIGLAIVRALVAARTERVVLAARDREGVEKAAASLRGGGARDVSTVAFDATDRRTHDDAVAAGFAGGDLDVAIVAFGLLGDQAEAETDPAAAVRLAEVNHVGAVSVLVRLAERLRAQGHGTIVVLSTVAAERARRSNFAYGSAKAGLDAFATGLREALREHGVRVVVVRPGFVHSAMTEGLDPVPFATTPEAVATAVVEALGSRRDEIWTPSILRWVMSVLRHVPAPIFRRLPV